MRLAYTLKKTWLHRHSLATFLKSAQQLQNVTQLTPPSLEHSNIKALALDFDGVLAPHGDIAPLATVNTWLHALSKTWEGQIFILSNKPFQAREAYFTKHFPMIQFIKNVAKKPYPDGLNTITTLAQCQPQEVLMIDDRLLTGILAAQLSGTQALWLNPAVRQPSWSRQEVFFACLRLIDCWLIRTLACF
jgi:HAD superfamily phosphatase (TIGR01668 family)